MDTSWWIFVMLTYRPTKNRPRIGGFQNSTRDLILCVMQGVVAFNLSNTPFMFHYFYSFALLAFLWPFGGLVNATALKSCRRLLLGCLCVWLNASPAITLVKGLVLHNNCKSSAVVGSVNLRRCCKMCWLLVAECNVWVLHVAWDLAGWKDKPVYM